MAASISDSPAEVVVAGHICLDVIPVLHGPARIEPGRLLEIGPAEMSTGGAVPNIGLSLHRLGVPVRLMGKVGDDLFGSAVLEALRARDPELAADMVVGAGETTSYSIVISPPGVDRSLPALLRRQRHLHRGRRPLRRAGVRTPLPFRLSADHAGDVRGWWERAAADARAGARCRSDDLAGHVPPGSGRRRRAGGLAAACWRRPSRWWTSSSRASRSCSSCWTRPRTGGSTAAPR